MQKLTFNHLTGKQMKLAVNNFPNVARAYGSERNPVFITGINEIYRDPQKAGIFTPGWQPLLFGANGTPYTPELLVKLLKELQKTGVTTVNLKIETEGVNEPNNPDFKITELI